MLTIGCLWKGLFILAFLQLPDDLLRKVEVLPQPWFSLASEDAEQTLLLKELVQLPSDQLKEMLERGTARERGAAVFAMAERGDLEALLAASSSLDDLEETVPVAVFPALGGYQRKPQTVGELLARAYDYWFGMGAPTSLEQFRASQLASIGNAEQLAYPWVVRLRRARMLRLEGEKCKEFTIGLTQLGEREIRDVKARIEKLPESLRWVVVTMAYLEGKQIEHREENRYYTEQEARRLLASLSLEQRQLILDHNVDLTFDARTRDAADGQEASRLVEEAIRLIKEPSLQTQSGRPKR